MVPLVTKLGSEFQKLHPGVKFEITGGGAGKGVKDSLSGKVELGMVSRELEPDEAQRGSCVAIAKDSVFMTASAGNPVAKELAAKGMSKKVCKALWLGGRAMTWGEIVGTDCKDPVAVYTREDACGAADTFAKFLGATQADLKGTAVKGDKGVAESVKKDSKAIGFNNLQAAFDLAAGTATPGMLVLSIDVNDNGKVDPEEDVSTKEKALTAVSKGVYPAPPARSLYLLTKGKFSGASKEFVAWVLKDGQKVVAEAGYLPLEQTASGLALTSLDK